MAEPTAAVRAGTARQALAPEWPHLRRAAMLSVASGLLWLPLAGFAAMALAGLLEGALVLPAVAGLLVCGGLRAALATMAEAAAQRTALAAVSRLRGGLLERVSRRADLPRAGAFASVAGIRRR